MKPTKLATLPALCILIYLVMVAVVYCALFGTIAFLMPAVWQGSAVSWKYYMVVESSLLCSVVVVAWFMLTYIEGRPFSDLGLTLRGHVKEWAYGLLLALLLYAVGFGASLSLGAVQVVSVQFHPVDLLIGWCFFLLVASAEEILVRGYLLGHLLRAGMNPYWALLLSSLVFAAAHLFNPGISFLPLLNLVLAGVMLGAAYLYTCNLWFPISLHLFWNWIQGPLLGYEVSGNTFGTSLLTLNEVESGLISGGVFGFEGSILCTVLLIASSAVLLIVKKSL